MQSWFQNTALGNLRPDLTVKNMLNGQYFTTATCGLSVGDSAVDTGTVRDTRT